MARSSLVLLSCVALLMVMLQGCGNDEEEPAPSTAEAVDEREVVEVIVEKPVPVPEKSPDCTVKSDASAATRAWCQGFDAWKLSALFAGDDNRKRDVFINAYGLGQQNAAMAGNPKPHSNQPAAEAGYRSGYQTAIEAQGLVQYACDGDANNEYQDRWCEASDAYNVSGLGSPGNAVLQGRFIDGYMSGRAIALTIPSGMEIMLSGETKAGERKAVTEPSSMRNKAERAFYQGFDEGYRTMLALIQESISQMMEQMPRGLEAMPSMPGMDSTMPSEPANFTE